MLSILDNHDVLAVHAIPVIVQEEDVVCPMPNCDSGNVSHTQTNIASSRPSSQLSQNGSSGYGSTRSQVGPFGTSNRPSPASSSSSSSSGSGSGSDQNKKTATAKPKRSVWFGGSLRRLSSARTATASAGSVANPQPQADPELEVLPPETSKTRGTPQYASLRIPNRIRHHSSHGELPSFEDRGLDLAEAEVDSDVEERPIPAPRSYSNLMNYPLRHASSLEAQVSFFHFHFHFF